MGITSEQYERIIRFLDADMEPDEMEAFEKELTANPSMRSQLDFEQSVRDSLTLANITHLPDTVPEDQGQAAVKTGKITRMQKWLAVGAAVVTACMLFIVFRQKPVATTDIADRKNIEVMDTVPETVIPPEVTVTAPVKEDDKGVDLALLFKQYFKKDALPEDYPVFLAEALTDYESGNYATLQKLNLNDLPQTRGAGATNSKENILQLGHYYKGLAFLQTNNTRDAITNLQWVLNNQPDKLLQAKAQWYLALAYLKENNGEKAAELCRRIANNMENDTLVKSAKKILVSLEK